MIVVSVVLLLIVLGAGAGYWFITKSHPQTSGALQLPGLEHPVTVTRDANGVPHIYADTPHDLFMAQGYVQAQDRLWQMEFNRHVGHAQLAELFGADLVDEDTFLRTL
ncbi:MAG: penicillin acylase family protein, partial [Chloroflexi bacterium]